MPRQTRIDTAGALHHIMARGIERRKIFDDDHDRHDFLKRLALILKETQTPCYAWALIPNHFHLLLRTGGAPLATVMRRLLTGYAQGYNRRNRRHGHLFCAAPMHDVGKIAVPDRILLKPGKLDAEEWEIMKQHTALGADILEGSSASSLKLAEIISLTIMSDGTGQVFDNFTNENLTYFHI